MWEITTVHNLGTNQYPSRGGWGGGGFLVFAKKALVQFQIVGDSVSDKNPLGLSPGILLNTAAPIQEKKLPTKPGADLKGRSGGRVQECATSP